MLFPLTRIFLFHCILTRHRTERGSKLFPYHTQKYLTLLTLSIPIISQKSCLIYTLGIRKLGCQHMNLGINKHLDYSRMYSRGQESWGHFTFLNITVHLLSHLQNILILTKSFQESYPIRKSAESPKSHYLNYLSIGCVTVSFHLWAKLKPSNTPNIQ